MLKIRKAPKEKPKQLLVEGNNDRHVIWTSCDRYQLPETFSVEILRADEGQGIEVLLANLPYKLRENNLQTLGIVADADRDLGARWQAIINRLNGCGYDNIPQILPEEGWVFPSINPFFGWEFA